MRNKILKPNKKLAIANFLQSLSIVTLSDYHFKDKISNYLSIYKHFNSSSDKPFKYSCNNNYLIFHQ